MAVLEPDARVDPLLPHDALLVLERSDPDLVLVESAAFSPGGPWAHGGDPSVADVAGRLFDILAAARSLDRPTVLWWNRPRSATPGLIPLETHFSIVVGAETLGDDDPAVPWTPGVQLTRVNAIALDPTRPMRPVFAGGWDPATHRWTRAYAAAALATLTNADLGLDIWLDDDADARWLPGHLRPFVRRGVGPLTTTEGYRTNALFLADPLAQRASAGSVSSRTLEQLASGARVVSGPNAALAATVPEGVSWIGSPADATAAVREAIERGLPGPDERRRILRALFERHATGVALASLGRYLGLHGRPSRDREACAIFRLGPGVRAEAFVDSLLCQRLRPTEAILVCDDPRDARVAVAELEAAGIAARAVAGTATGERPLRSVAADTGARWLWAWSPDRRLEPTLLLDLMAGATVSGADAVGWVEDGEDRFIGELPIDGSVVSRSTALARPEPVNGSLGGWAQRGARLFGLGIAVGTEAGGDR